MKEISSADWTTEVENESKLVLVDFAAPWCGPCQQLSPILESLANEKSDEVKIVKVNIDDEGELAQKFGIMSVPTMLFFKDGENIEQLAGYQPKEALIETIERLK